MNRQLNNIALLFSGQVLIKSSSFLKQLIMAFFLGVSGRIDVLLVAQIIPNIIGSMISGGAGELLVTKSNIDHESNSKYVTQYTFLTVVIISIVLCGYWLSIPIFNDLLEVKKNDHYLFLNLTFLLILSKVFGSVVSCLQQLLYLKNLYKKFIFISLFSELIGILVILSNVRENEILAFAYGILVTSILNATLFFIVHKLPIFSIFDINSWKENWLDLIQHFKKIFTLSIQTLINHTSSFWERIISYKFLQAGYLSALNYSRSLTELPKMAFLSSVLTTSYIEQNKRRQSSHEQYQSYSRKVDVLLNETGFFFQVVSMLLSPIILVVFFKRGAFDRHDLEITLGIYQIFILGFLPGLMFNFLTRTMFIEAEMKRLFWVFVFKTTFEILFMTLFIEYFAQAIPIVLTISKYIFVFYLYHFLTKKNSDIFNRKKSIKLYLIAIISSLLIYWINRVFVHNILSLSIFDLFLYYSPILFLILIASFYFLKNIKRKIKGVN